MEYGIQYMYITYSIWYLNVSILQTRVSEMSLVLGPEGQNVRSLCLCDLQGPENKASKSGNKVMSQYRCPDRHYGVASATVHGTNPA